MFVRIHNLSKHFADNTVLSGVNLMLTAPHKYGLIGSNGSGKTTFLKILAGLERHDRGNIEIDPPHARINYIPQALYIDNLIQNLLSSNYDITAFIYLLASHREYFDLWKSIHTSKFNQDGIEVWDKYMEIGGYELENKIFQLCKKYDIDPDAKVVNLSGGQKTRLQIIRLHLFEGDILLLDEPTNNLDQEGMDEFYQFIREFEGIVIMASHDRNLLNSCVDKILLIDNKSLVEYTGNYDKYYQQKTLERLQAEKRLKENEKKISKLNLAAKRIERIVSKHIERKQNLQKALSKVAKLDRKTKALKTKLIKQKLKLYRDNDRMQAKYLLERQSKKLRQNRQVILDKAQQIAEKSEPTKFGWSMKLDFGTQKVEGDVVLEVQDLVCGYGDLKIIENFNLTIKPSDKIALIGQNGVGKSTLLKTLAGILKPLSGTIKIAPTCKIGYLDQENMALDQKSMVIEEFLKDARDMNEQEARSFLHFFLFAGDMPLRKVGTLSEGEKVKLKLAKLLYSKANLLFLDEPTNHLDIPSQEAVEKALKDFDGAMILVTHDRTLLQNLGIQKTIKLERVR